MEPSSCKFPRSLAVVPLWQLKDAAWTTKILGRILQRRLTDARERLEHLFVVLTGTPVLKCYKGGRAGIGVSWPKSFSEQTYKQTYKQPYKQTYKETPACTSVIKALAYFL